MDDGVDEGGEAEEVEDSRGLFQCDHIPAIDSDAGHSPLWTVPSHEPPHPPTNVAVEYCDEERGHKLHYHKFDVVFPLLPCQS